VSPTGVVGVVRGIEANLPENCPKIQDTDLTPQARSDAGTIIIRRRHSKHNVSGAP
jgi:hypothetical protein